MSVLVGAALFALPPAAVADGHVELGVAVTAGSVIRGTLGSRSDPETPMGFAYGGAITSGVRIGGGLRIGVHGAYEGFKNRYFDSPGIWMGGPWVGGRWGRRARIGFMIAGGVAYASEVRSTSHGVFFDMRLGPAFEIAPGTELYIDLSVFVSRRMTRDNPNDPWLVENPDRRTWGSGGSLIIPFFGPANFGVRAYF